MRPTEELNLAVLLRDPGGRHHGEDVAADTGSKESGLHLAATTQEVLGATENSEVEYHLGSFCLSINQNILQSSAFKRYWTNYKNSNIRPKIIKNGEMGLTRALKKCVTSQDKISALFNAIWFSQILNENSDILEKSLLLSRKSELVHWKRPSLQTIASNFYKKNILLEPTLSGLDFSVQPEKETDYAFFINTAKDLKETIGKLTSIDSETVDRLLDDQIRAELTSCFVSGSQIHQNGVLLHYLGLPMIKLDALFRGMFSYEDIEAICKQLESDEVLPFKNLIYARPFGGHCLTGWKRSAFYHGLI